ncbi:MAG: type II toxin-antitoxin system VapC family toxin [Hyphomonadaceae bacterium]
MTFVIDASIGLKWVLTEAGSDRASALLADEPLAAPELFWVECANVLWVKARRGQITDADARTALGAIVAAPVAIVPAQALAGAAQAIAFELDQTAYDCLYLAAALAARMTLITADEAFANAALAHPVYTASVRQL